MTLTARLTALADAIRELGVNAGIDPADLTPPAVLVGVDTIDTSTLAGAPLYIASLDVLAPDRTRPGTYDDLDAVFTALSTLPLTGVSSVTNAAGQVIGWRATIDLP